MRRNAFTMVELVAATALSTLLFVVALSVIRSLHPIADARATAVWTDAARRQIEWDLSNAVVFRQDDHGLILAGYASLDPTTLAPTHLPVVVTYSLRSTAAGQWLVREQTPLGPNFADPTWTEVVCGDVKSFTFTGSYAARAAPVDPRVIVEDATPVVFRSLADTRPVPDRARLRIQFSAANTPAVDEVLFLK